MARAVGHAASLERCGPRTTRERAQSGGDRKSCSTPASQGPSLPSPRPLSRMGLSFQCRHLFGRSAVAFLDAIIAAAPSSPSRYAATIRATTLSFITVKPTRKPRLPLMPRDVVKVGNSHILHCELTSPGRLKAAIASPNHFQPVAQGGDDDYLPSKWSVFANAFHHPTHLPPKLEIQKRLEPGMQGGAFRPSPCSEQRNPSLKLSPGEQPNEEAVFCTRLRQLGPAGSHHLPVY